MQPSSLPNYLRSYRLKASLTQDEVGFLLGGTHGSTITRHEEYHRIPSLPLALGYSAIYGIDPRVLFAGRYEAATREVRRRADRLLAGLADDQGEESRRSAFLYRLAHDPDSYLVPCEDDEC